MPARHISGSFLLLAGLCGSLATARAGEPIPIGFETHDLVSAAQPAGTPGTPGVTVTNEKLLTQFGGAEIDLNRARYTRYYAQIVGSGLRGARSGLADPPDAILVLIPGFEGGAGSFKVLAENLIRRSLADWDMRVEVWAFDRRSNLLEDLDGLDIAEGLLDPVVAVDWLYGGELGLELSKVLERRAVFYNETDDVPFLANWTALVHSMDIDAVVEAARSQANDGVVFLGGHSAGTGYTARYAATDFDPTGQDPDPGYLKLRGLVLLEGGGAGPSDGPVSEETLDLIEARFDGGLEGAVRDQEPRCIDGETACTVETQEVDCGAFENVQCVEPTAAYAVVAGLLNARTLSTLDALGIQMASGDADAGISIVQRDFGEKGNYVLAAVPDLNPLDNPALIPRATAEGAVGRFLDDDGLIASFAGFVATSLGAAGPVTKQGLATWLDADESLPKGAFADNGEQPTELPAGTWGIEAEPTRFARMRAAFYEGGTNFSDWYYPSSGLGVTSGLGLDTSALSLDPPMGRGRRDIANRIHANAVDIPVIGFGGSNGFATVPADFAGYAMTLAPCAAGPICDGQTPRIVDAENPNPAYPTFGGMAGGYEAYISEGYSHVDIVSADDEPGNQVIGPLARFLRVHTVPEPGAFGQALGAALGLAIAARLQRGMASSRSRLRVAGS